MFQEGEEFSELNSTFLESVENKLQGYGWREGRESIVLINTDILERLLSGTRSYTGN